MNTALEITFYAINLFLFYGVLIPNVGSQIYDKCLSSSHCSSTVQHAWHGLRIDVADGQWREFRNTLPLLCCAAVVITILHYGLRQLHHSHVLSLLKSQHFHLVTGFIVLFVQHGWHAFVVLLIISVFFVCSRLCRQSKLSPVIMWTLACSVIALKESYRIIKYPAFQGLSFLFNRRWSGLYAWHVPANFLVLRLISFHFDYYWAIQSMTARTTGRENDDKLSKPVPSGQSSVQKVEGVSPSSHSASRVGSTRTLNEIASRHRPLEEYNLLNFLSYCNYAPLYVAGPIVTFNTYMEFSKSPQKTENVIVYGLRWLGAFGLLEVMTSYFPFFSAIRVGLFNTLSPVEMAVLAYVLLKMMWLKFLVIWRFFRLWALADGMWVPENMTRCMSNNCSLEQFWKGWHSSFNLWIVRYMYKPMGGRNRRLLNVWVIFAFVAIWHDVELKLLVWGALNSVFFVFEAIGRWLGKTTLMQSLPAAIRRTIEIMASAFYIIILIAVNLVGYAVGTGGVRTLLSRIVSTEGFYTVLGTFYFFSVGVCIMQFLKRHGYSS